MKASERVRGPEVRAGRASSVNLRDFETMARATFKSLLLGLALVAAASPHARAQDGVAPEKRAAVRKLLEVTTPARHMSHIFERLMTRYQGPWFEGLLKGPNMSRALDRFTPEQRPEVERLMKEFGDNVFSEVKRRVGSEIFTPENVEELALPVFDKHFTLEEINALAAFFRSPAGQKLAAAYPRAMADATVAAFEQRGFFDTLASPAAQAAKLSRFDAEMRADPSALFRSAAAAAQASASKYFDEQDARALDAFLRTPLGRKLAEVTPRLSVEIAPAFFLRQLPRLQQLIDEVYKTQLRAFASKLERVSGEGAPPPPPRSNVQPAARRRAP